MNNISSRDLSRLSLAALILLALLSLFLLSKTVNEIRAGKYIGPNSTEAYTITVSGEGEIFAVPDEAQFTFTVREEANTVETAQSSVTDKQNEILAYLEGEGIPDENIKTIGYNIFPQYTYRNESVPCSPEFCPPSDGGRTLVGYEVAHTIEITLDEAEEAGTLIGGIGSRGVSEISGVQFTLGNEDEIMRQARRQAIEDAKAKAEALSDDLGVALGPLVSFSESGSPKYFSERVSMDAAEEGFAGAPTPQIPQGENRVVSEITLVYEIR